MSPAAVLFPGQGEQRPGMLHELPPEGDAVLQAAADALGEDPLLLDAPDVLHGTRATQLALLVAGVSWYRAAVARGLAVGYLGGHSIGHWAAAVSAGALDLPDALRLVALRGEAMRAASPAGSGMIAVLGLREDAVERVAASARDAGLLAWSSNVNADGQVAVSGTEPGLDRVTELARAAGAQRVVRLAVEVPAHSPLMAPAAERLRRALDGIEVRRPSLPLVGNLTGQTLFTADALRRELWSGIERPVRWRDGTRVLAERGVTRWLQVPPGRSLAQLASALPDARALAVDDVGLDEAVARLARS
jgi:malonate decarboxylase epsilon subunit